MSSNTNCLIVETRNAIQLVTINRPGQRNALTLQLWRELHSAISDFSSDENLNLLIVRGAGERAFAAGSDIRELPEVYADPDTSADYDKTLLDTQNHLAACHKPTIAMIYGHCAGGGLGIATACDFRFAASNAVFTVPPARLGLVYGVSATRRLVQLIGPASAKELLMSARNVEADEAWRLGLVDQLYETTDLEQKTLQFASTVCTNSQFSVRASKRIVQRILSGYHDDDDDYFALVREAVHGPDFKEGLNAFLSKRKPDFPVK